MIRHGEKIYLLLCFALTCVMGSAVPYSAKAQTETQSIGQENKERLDQFTLLTEKLKSAVCDEQYVSRAPSLESMNAQSDDDKPDHFLLTLPPGTLGEVDVIELILGSPGAMIPSDYMRTQLTEAAGGQPAKSLVQAMAGSSNSGLSARLVSLKRKLSLEICQGLVEAAKFRMLLDAKPSRFFTVEPVRAPAAAGGDSLRVEISDSQGRIASMKALSGATRYLVAGWVEPFEVERVRVKRGTSERMYERLANPVSQNTESVEIVHRSGVPIGTFYVTQDLTGGALNWTSYIASASGDEMKKRQINQYRQRMEFDALRVMSGSPAQRKKVRDLHEFYRNLLQAYQLFPDEKQFDSYGKRAKNAGSLEAWVHETFDDDFLKNLSAARVNGQSVRLALFKPDPKLHAIYQEFRERLGKAAGGK